MKKWIAFLLALACLLSLCACDSEENNKEEETESKYVTVYLPSEEVYNNGTTYTYTYDDDGNLTEQICYRDGEEIVRYTYRYDSNGNEIEYIYYRDGEENTRYTYVYDEDNKLNEHTRYSRGMESERCTYVHDDEKNTTTMYYYSRYDSDYASSEYELYNIVIETRDDQDRIIQEAHYEADDEDRLDRADPFYLYTYVYEDDRLVEWLRYDEDDLQYRTVYEYNKQGDKVTIIQIYYEDGNEDSRRTNTYEYTYDERGNISEVKQYSDGEFQTSYTRTYVKVKMLRTKAKELGYI